MRKCCDGTPQGKTVVHVSFVTPTEKVIARVSCVGVRRGNESESSTSCQRVIEISHPDPWTPYHHEDEELVVDLHVDTWGSLASP